MVDETLKDMSFSELCEVKKCVEESLSDIDLAIDAGKKISWSVLGKIKEECEESNIPFFVDILDVRDVSDDIKKRILEEGIIWHQSS